VSARMTRESVCHGDLFLLPRRCSRAKLDPLGNKRSKICATRDSIRRQGDRFHRTRHHLEPWCRVSGSYLLQPRRNPTSTYRGHYLGKSIPLLRKLLYQENCK